MARFAAVLLAASGLLLAAPATGAPEPSPVLTRVRARQVVRCGGVERPGLAQARAGGRASGLEVDVCRAVAAAVLGSPERVEFRLYGAPAAFEAVRSQADDVFFLTGAEIAEQELAGAVLPLTPVFMEAHAVMVPAASSRRSLPDLAGEGICFLIGGSAGRSLEAAFDRLHRTFFRHAYSEDGEMSDAYAARRCHAIAGEVTELARLRGEPGAKGLASRILPEPLSAFPVLAATGTRDGRWAALVAWTVHTLVSGERPETRWYAGGAGAMPLPGEALGLDPGWQRRVLGAVGSYGELYDRNLGKGSALGLDRRQGGVLTSPYVD
jgi:general L-amino acid transport system substrate-binding protein